MVIGAGPAGATAALRARSLGLSVALIDKARFPRNKLCGGAITGRCMAHLGDVYAALPVGLWLDAARVQIVAGGRVLADLNDTPVISYTMRCDFDVALLAQALSAGAQDFTGCRVGALDGCSVVLEDGRRLQGQVLIGADGVNSMVGRALFGRAHDPDRIGFALEAEVRAAPGSADPVAVLDVTAAQWGYGWVFPKAGGLTLGIGGVHGRNPDMKATFHAWLQARGYDPARLTIKGHHLPFGDPRPDSGRGAVLLAGDAAGLVDPITGEGIAWAVKSGQLAAEAAAEAIASGQAEAAMAGYVRRLRPVQVELRRARILARLIYHPLLQRRFIGLLAQSERLQRRYFDLLAGKMDYADLTLASFARLAWRMATGRIRRA